MNSKMLTKTLAVSLISAAVLAGCSSVSGPAFNISEITTSNGQKAFRAERYGLFENGSACMTAAQKICGNQPVNVLQTIAGTNAAKDPRNVIFNCAAPVQPAPAAPAAPVAEPQPAPVVVPAAPRKVVLDEKTNFDFDSADLKPKAKATLDKLVADAGGVRFGSVTVEGYTDSTGPSAYNVGLSQRRAAAVVDYLRSHGLNADNYSVKGFGKSNPVATNATTVGRAENRRVEVTLTP